MSIEQIKLTQQDGHISNVTKYAVASEKKGSLLLLHGMAENFERYDEFARSLSSNGYDVYLYSHRGHGTHLAIEDLGYFGPKDGYQLVINDAITILTYIRQQEPNLPLFLMGHSMGSIITRNIIQTYHDLDAIIICGTANPAPYMTKFGLFVSSLTGYKKHPKKKSPMMNQLMFSGRAYSKCRKRTSNDWLCTDEAVVDAYNENDYCGFICTKSFYHDLLMLTKNATTPAKMLQTKKDKPILIISGDADPVGGCGKDVNRLIVFYKQHGYQVKSKLYPGLRHEILNEPCKNDITIDILSFMNDI